MDPESINRVITDEWKLLDIYFRDHMYPFTKHHLDSFRQFLKVHIPETIKSYNPITMVKLDSEGEESIKVDVYVGGLDGTRLYIDRPTHLDDEGKQMLLSPQDARLLNLTYNTKIYADIQVIYSKTDENNKPIEKIFPHTLIGSIPLMLHSDQCMLHGQGSKILRSFGECPMDPGGYFIIDGKEKVIISQERITTNRLFISKVADDNDDTAVRAYIRCTGTTGESALIPRTVELRLLRTGCYEKNNEDCYDEPVKVNHIKTQGAIIVSLPSIAGSWPLASVFRALGFESDKEIVEAICGPIEEAHPAFLAFLRPSLVHGGSTGKFTMEEIHDQMRPFTYFKTVQQVKSVLALDVFPNIEGTIRDKGIYLGYLVSMLMKTALGVIPESDRDSYAFKRVDISGILLAQLYQKTYGQFRKHVRDTLDQEYNYGPWKNTGQVEDIVRKDNLHRIFPSNIVTEIFIRSLKGMWGPPSQDPEQGKVQDLSRITYIGALSHLRRVNLPLDRSIKVTSPHRLHSQQWGIMCPFESPDGASIGYLKNFALMTQITAGSDPRIIEQILEEMDIIPLRMISHTVAMHNDTIRIFINGSWYGITSDPFTLVKILRLYRRNGLINPFVSISWNIRDKEIRIQTEPGRPCRPLLVVENDEIILGKVATSSKTTWFDLLYGSLIPDKDRLESRYYTDEYISPENFSSLHNLDNEALIKALQKTQAPLEYIDIEEENTMYVAMKKDDITPFHTHVEIHPSTAFSIVTQIVPFANHNQAPRIIFHAAQSKQALGIYTTNFNNRFDTASYIQHYPQRRIIGTKGGHYNGNDRMPNGANVIVAIQTFTGFNQEDSIMINKSSVDRGLFRVTAYKTLTAVEKTLNANEKIMFANPTLMRDNGTVVENIKHADYTLLNDDGIIKEESYIPSGQEAIVLGMVHVRDNVKEVQRGVLIEKQIEKEYRDISLKTDVHYYGKIDRVFLGHQIPGNPNRICKVRFRKSRRPEFGDKHCSSHGQKGVVGMIITQENMPFTKDGIVPDIIINPHAFPSRMTMGHVIETIFAKLCCIEGTRGDGTVFMPFDKEAIFNTLEEHGLEKHGNEVLYNGRTGEQIKTEIFIGPIYYYRLKHMVTDKIHSRSTGPKVQLTHQPTSGRSAGGGLRIGEMERDVLLSHGLSQFAKECMMEKSDSYRWGVCRHCGILANYTPRRNIIECLNCGLQDISVIETPYAFKLLIQEMEAMGIQIRISSEEFPEGEENAATDFMYQELYNYIEPNKQTTKKGAKKAAAAEAAADESESDAEGSEAAESEEGSDAESELSAAASEMEGGEDNPLQMDDSSFNLGANTNTSNVLSVGIVNQPGGELDLDLDMDGIYGGDTSNPPSILDQLNGGSPLTIVSSSQLDSSESVGGSPNTESNIQQLSSQSPVVIQPPNTGNGGGGGSSGNQQSDIKVININNRNQLPEPKGGSSGGDNEKESDDFDGGDDEFFTD
jgi:DNA-directed RNA polymerase II subunit RPB2